MNFMTDRLRIGFAIPRWVMLLGIVGVILSGCSKKPENQAGGSQGGATGSGCG